MACNESTRVNVGGPDNSQKDRVWENEPKSRGLQEDCREVRCIVVPEKQSNVCGGKDAG